MGYKYRPFSAGLIVALTMTGIGIANAQAVVTTPATTYNGISTTTGTPTSQTTTTTTTVPGALTSPAVAATAPAPSATAGLATTTPGTANSADLQRYANMVNQQGSQSGGTDNAQQSQVQYYYKPTDPNDPLATVEMPARLFNNIPMPNY